MAALGTPLDLEGVYQWACRRRYRHLVEAAWQDLDERQGSLSEASVRMSNTFQTRLCFESVDTGLRSREDALSALKNTIFLSGAHPAADGAAWRDAQRVVDEACVACATIALRHALAKADGQIDPAGPIDRRGLVDAMDRIFSCAPWSSDDAAVAHWHAKLARSEKKPLVEAVQHADASERKRQLDDALPLGWAAPDFFDAAFQRAADYMGRLEIKRHGEPAAYFRARGPDDDRAFVAREPAQTAAPVAPPPPVRLLRANDPPRDAPVEAPRSPPPARVLPARAAPRSPPPPPQSGDQRQMPMADDAADETAFRAAAPSSPQPRRAAAARPARDDDDVDERFDPRAHRVAQPPPPPPPMASTPPKRRRPREDFGFDDSDDDSVESPGADVRKRESHRDEKGKPVRKRKKWTPEEVAALKTGMETHGMKWSVIVDKFSIFGQTGRTGVDLRDKWRNIEKLKKTNNVVDPDQADRPPRAAVPPRAAMPPPRRVRTMDDIDIDEDEEAELDDAVAPERRAATPGGDGPRSTGRRADERSPSSARSAAGSPAPWPPPCADRGAQRGRWPDWLTAAQRWVATHLAQEAGAKTHLSKVRAAFAASGDFPSEDVALFADLENARSDASKSFKSRALQPHVGAGGICDKVSIRGVNQIGLVGWRLADRSEALQADEALVADEAKRADERRRSAAGRLAPSQENDDETQDETPDETQECAAPDAEIRDAEMRDVRDEAPPPPPPPEEPPRAPPAALVAGFAPATPAAASAPTPAAAAAPTSATPARPRDSISSASAAEAQEPETQERPQVWKNTAPSPIDSVSEASSPDRAKRANH